MKPLYTKQEFDNAKSGDKLPCECYECGKTFYKQKRTIIKVINFVGRHNGKYCSQNCAKKQFIKKKKVVCDNCDNTFYKTLSEIKKSKNNFCSKSCSAIYNNKNKTFGIRRSKLEKYIEFNLNKLYPKLHIKYNYKKIINSELDIYIPELKLAFEINGIVHYKSIFGIKKFNQIVKNDKLKIKLCKQNNIKLYIIDTSELTHFKENESKKYLNIIIKHIKLLA